MLLILVAGSDVGSDSDCSVEGHLCVTLVSVASTMRIGLNDEK